MIGAMSEPPLQVGDLVRCPHCRSWHSAIQWHTEGTAYTLRMLDFECGGRRFLQVYTVSPAGTKHDRRSLASTDWIDVRKLINGLRRPVVAARNEPAPAPAAATTTLGDWRGTGRADVGVPRRRLIALNHQNYRLDPLPSAWHFLTIYVPRSRYSPRTL